MRTSRVITPALASWERCQLHEAGTLARVAVLAPRQHRQQLGRVNVSGQHATPPRGSAGPTTSVLLDGVPVTVQPPTVGTSPTLVWPRPAGHRWQPTRVRSKPSRSTPMDASWPPAAGHQHVDHVPSAAQHAGPAIFKKLPRDVRLANINFDVYVESRKKISPEALFVSALQRPTIPALSRSGCAATGPCTATCRRPG